MYECIDGCDEELIEVYLPDSDECYVMDKTGSGSSIKYKNKRETVPFQELIAVLKEDEAWCPIHQKVLVWNPEIETMY